MPEHSVPEVVTTMAAHEELLGLPKGGGYSDFWVADRGYSIKKVRGQLISLSFGFGDSVECTIEVIHPEPSRWGGTEQRSNETLGVSVWIREIDAITAIRERIQRRIKWLYSADRVLAQRLKDLEG